MRYKTTKTLLFTLTRTLVDANFSAFQSAKLQTLIKFDPYLIAHKLKEK